MKLIDRCEKCGNTAIKEYDKGTEKEYYCFKCGKTIVFKLIKGKWVEQ
jgi:formylmethanofuran dehydrogenase subunit E